MILLSGFLDVLFRAFVFVGLALSIGGVAFYYLVLRPLRMNCRVAEIASRRSASLVVFGAFLVAASQLLTLIVAVWALAGQTGGWPLHAFLATNFARAGTIHAALALCLGFIALGLRRRPSSPVIWGAAAVLATLVMVSGAWLTHGASRLQNAAPLMSVTVIHQFAAAVWIGGVIHLTAQWRFLRRSPDGQDIWPRMLSRFSPLALASVGLLVAAGLYLYWQYIGSVDGLVGTAYGTMLITKVALMASLLFLGGMNNLSIRQWKLGGDRTELLRRVPVFAEVEAGVGIIVLMAAAALTGQPPAVDVPSQWATPAQVLHTFAPKMPQLTPPPYAKMLSGAGLSLDLFWLPTHLQKIQSDFNHNISGICVILIGLGALLNRATRARWTRHWPLLFMPLAVFLLIIGEPTGWPLGNEGFFKTLISPEVLTHRLATLIVIVLGMFEWRVQAGALAGTRWRYLFPLLCGVGGALLLTHSHTVFAITWAFLIEVSHNAMGVLAVMIGAAGWMEMRMSGRESRIAGLVWPVCLTLLGFVLLFYRET